MKKTKILLIEPPGGFIRLDRCMQKIDSWGGVFRFPLNLARIGAGLLSEGYLVEFIDLQADTSISLKNTLKQFKPDMCILSCGFPSMHHDMDTASLIKNFSEDIHVSTFGVVPTLLKESFFLYETWQRANPFDSVVLGGEPALGYLGYLELINNSLNQQIVESVMEKHKTIDTSVGRKLFKHDLYRSPFNGFVQAYVEGSYGCPKRCNFCVVPQLYGGRFAKRSPEDVVSEFQFVIENNGARQISLWDEGTTFQRKQIKEICEGLIELRKSKIPAFQNFVWNTRSTTALVDEEIASLMKQSGLSGLTLGLESFDESILTSTGKGTTIENNYESIQVLKKAGIISIGHIVLGLPDESRESAETTIQGVINSGLDIAQFYCAIPYPGTPLYDEADSKGLIQVSDLTQYELCNPIMDTYHLSHLEVGDLRDHAMKQFYASKNDSNIEMLKSNSFKRWAKI